MTDDADELEEVECALDETCDFCTGAACALCGAGWWRPVYGVGGTLEQPCEHDVVERHMTRKVR
jgi:hypothetical protein